MPDYDFGLPGPVLDRITRDARHAAAQNYEGTYYYDAAGLIVGRREKAAYTISLHYGCHHTGLRAVPGGHILTIRGLKWPEH